jgi:hypothetical protein
MVMYYKASATEANAEKFLKVKFLEAQLASKTKELDWANDYMSRLEKRIVELHKFIDELREVDDMARDIETDCHECRHDDCMSCPCVPELARADVQKPYTL